MAELSNPNSHLAKEYFQKHGILQDQKPHSVKPKARGKLQNQKISHPNAILPPEYRKNPSFLPPAVEENEVRYVLCISFYDLIQASSYKDSK